MKWNRRSIRLTNFDYATPAAYFVTICVHQRHCLFGDIRSGQMHLNPAGGMIEKTWLAIPQRYPHIDLDSYVIMPDHMHGIIVLGEIKTGAKAIGAIIGWFKTLTTHEYARGVHAGVNPPFDRHIWQRNYWDHIIRNDQALTNIRNYIDQNPAHWENDPENPNPS